VLSALCWPSDVVADDRALKTYTPHSRITTAQAAVAATFKARNPGRSLCQIHRHSTVEISVTQKSRNNNQKGGGAVEERRTFTLSSAAASVALYLSERGTGAAKSAPIAEVAAALQIAAVALCQLIAPWIPCFFELPPPSAATGNVETVCLQLYLDATTGDDSATADHEDAAASGAAGAGGIAAAAAAAAAAPQVRAPPEVVELFQRMLPNMLRNMGPRTAAQIENSAKFLLGFKGTKEECREVLAHLVSTGHILLDSQGLYSIKK
jgi:hypothetical protein